MVAEGITRGQKTGRFSNIFRTSLFFRLFWYGKGKAEAPYCTAVFGKFTNSPMGFIWQLYFNWNQNVFFCSVARAMLQMNVYDYIDFYHSSLFVLWSKSLVNHWILYVKEGGQWLVKIFGSFMNIKLITID